MGITLRERRRRETARDIQMAAVGVILRCGYDHATTEAIAAEAGISTRTFFNYYSNKQAAILGKAAMLNTEDADWFIRSDGPIIDDIVQLLDQWLKDDQLDRQMLRKIIEVVEAHPVLLTLFRQRMDNTSRTMAGLLEKRLGSALAIEARLLAETATHSLTEAVRAWALDDNQVINDVSVFVGDKLRGVGRILGS